MSGLQVSEIEYGSEDYAIAFALREEVLRKPLGLSLNRETLEQEREYFHVVCHLNGELAGCLVLLPQSSHEIRMRQVAVKPQLQGKGIGRGLVEFAEQLARKRGFTLMRLHARDTAVGFYDKLGYERVGEPFEEVTILHWEMRRSL